MSIVKSDVHSDSMCERRGVSGREAAHTVRLLLTMQADPNLVALTDALTDALPDHQPEQAPAPVFAEEEDGWTPVRSTTPTPLCIMSAWALTHHNMACRTHTAHTSGRLSH